MQENILYMRGPFPFGPPGIPDDLIRDTKVLLDIDAALISAARDELQAYPGFLDRRTVESILGSYLEDAESCKALARLITGVDTLLAGAGLSIENLLSLIEGGLRDEENQQKDLLSPQEFAVLRDRLPLIAGPYPGRLRQAKARRLSEATGLPLEKIEIICDLRPVFDKDREVVEGIIPYTTLRIVCKGVDGLPVAMDAVLSHEDVVQLAKASEDAKKKLAKLHELMQEKDLSIPSIAITRKGAET